MANEPLIAHHSSLSQCILMNISDAMNALCQPLLKSGGY